MPPKRPKPPIETKAQMMQEVRVLLEAKFESPVSALEYLLNFFSSADLVGIRNELQEYPK